MKTNLITMAISIVVLVVTLLSSQALLVDPSAYTGYYITCVLTISGFLTAVTILRLLLMLTRHAPSSNTVAKKSSAQRRKHYRLFFEKSAPPLFVEATDQDLPADVFSCPVRDISETGLTLRCSSVYAAGQTVHGEVIFASGRTAPINGKVIREESDLTSLELHCTIDPSIFMAEQRELIESTKNAGPKPAVSRGALETPITSLPSHRPKGICRTK